MKPQDTVKFAPSWLARLGLNNLDSTHGRAWGIIQEVNEREKMATVRWVNVDLSPIPVCLEYLVLTTPVCCKCEQTMIEPTQEEINSGVCVYCEGR